MDKAIFANETFLSQIVVDPAIFGAEDEEEEGCLHEEEDEAENSAQSNGMLRVFLNMIIFPLTYSIYSWWRGSFLSSPLPLSLSLVGTQWSFSYTFPFFLASFLSLVTERVQAFRV